MHIKTFIGSCLATLMGAGLQLASSSDAQQPPGYETGFETVSRITGDLHQALDRSQRPALYPAAFLVTNLPTPWLQAYPLKGANATRAVCLSRGYVDLLNFISHAKAIDGVSHGFFIKAMARLALEGGEQLPDLQANAIHNSWSFETMNRQASSFNQMAGALVAIEMAHAYLGHYQKYGSQLTDSRGHSVPINRVINQAEWREAVMLGARHALDCGMAVDGIKMAFESVDKMPARPAWRIYFLPDAIEGKEVNRINRELDRIQKNAFVSFAR